MRNAAPGLSRVKIKTAAGMRVPTMGFMHSTHGAKHLGEVLYFGLDPRRQELGSETGMGKAKKGAHGVVATVGKWDSVPLGRPLRNLVEHTLHSSHY